MGERYWLWVGARLVVAAVLLAWAVSYLGTGSGEKEFKKTLGAMKQIHSFRASYSATPFGGQHNEMLWEVDCNRDLVHYQSDLVQSGTNPPTEMKEDQVNTGGKQYDHQSDGSWTPSKYSRGSAAAKWFCTSLAQGTDSRVFPDIATMIKRGILQKGDKKTINGVRCREWLVTMQGGYRGLEHDTVCLGLDDHLPYEMTVDYENSRTTFTDYNASLQIDAPDAAVQPASNTTGTN